MRILVLCAILLAGCQSPSAPVTLGPGCWTRQVHVLTLDNGTKATLDIDAHYPMCPDPMPDGMTLLRWDRH